MLLRRARGFEGGRLRRCILSEEAAMELTLEVGKIYVRNDGRLTKIAEKMDSGNYSSAGGYPNDDFYENHWNYEASGVWLGSNATYSRSICREATEAEIRAVTKVWGGVTMVEGGYYRSQGGEIYGPMKASGDSEYPWASDGRCWRWRSDGFYYSEKCDHHLNLVARVNKDGSPYVEAEAQSAGESKPPKRTKKEQAAFDAGVKQGRMEALAEMRGFLSVMEQDT